jgi:Ca-activated chloride channel homolog
VKTYRFLCIVLGALVVCSWLAWNDLSHAQQSANTGSDAKTTSIRVWPFLTQESGPVESVEKLTTRNFLLVFDGSGSMSEKECIGKSGLYANKLDAAKKAVLEWFKSVPPDANVGLVAFHTRGWSELPLGQRNISAIEKVLQGVQAGGQTPLGWAFKKANDMLTVQARRQLGYGEYTIVSVTDGQATDLADLEAMVKRILSGTPIIINTIGFCIGDKHALNQKGRTIYRAADSPEALQKGLMDVLAEAEHFDVSAFRK